MRRIAMYPQLLALTMTLAATSLTPGDATRTITVGTVARTYLVHIPPNYDGRNAVPVVLAFHGGGSNPRQMSEFSGLSDKANEAGFIVVYPAGSGRVEAALTWNAGNCCGYAQRQNVDDIGFVAALLDDLASAANVDAKSIYATGMSNGALMSYAVADRLASRIAAIAPVAGPMGTETCQPAQPVSVVHFHGTEDAFAPYAGGVGRSSITRTNFYSVDHTIGAWAAANGCDANPREETLPDVAKDGMHVTRKTYGQGRDGAEVILYTIHGGGHTWPGRQPKLRWLGASTQDISANDLMWEFFQRHAKK